MIFDDYDSYILNVINIFLYKRESAKKILTKIDNITRTSSYTLKMTISIVIFVILILCSLSQYLYNNSHHEIILTIKISLFFQ